MKTKNILVIDDEAGFTRLLKLTLEKTGLYQVHVENDSTKGLEAARDFHPDLVLLDVIMPGADGGDVAARFRSNPVLKRIPVIFLTAMISHHDHIPGNTIDGYPYLAKPVSLPDLIGTIEKCLVKAAQAKKITSVLPRAPL